MVHAVDECMTDLRERLKELDEKIKNSVPDVQAVALNGLRKLLPNIITALEEGGRNHAMVMKDAADYIAIYTDHKRLTEENNDLRTRVTMLEQAFRERGGGGDDWK